MVQVFKGINEGMVSRGIPARLVTIFSQNCVLFSRTQGTRTGTWLSISDSHCQPTAKLLTSTQSRTSSRTHALITHRGVPVQKAHTLFFAVLNPEPREQVQNHLGHPSSPTHCGTRWRWELRSYTMGFMRRDGRRGDVTRHALGTDSAVFW